jgi:[CysO sulfur-carrier protein]-S-L-cysteine hydrolase
VFEDDQIVAQARAEYPNEACGLLGGDPLTGQVRVFYPCRNEKASSRVFSIGFKDWAAAEDDADARGLALMGTMHSHTHTEAYPSPTDVDQAQAYEGIPGWHHVIVSLKREAPVLRSYQISGERITEEPVGLAG